MQRVHQKKYFGGFVVILGKGAQESFAPFQVTGVELRIIYKSIHSETY